MDGNGLCELRAGVNGGYFDPNFAPLGLRIIDGKITSRLSRGRLMSGVLASESVQILRLAEFSLLKKWNAAIEGGPFLVDHGQPVAAWKRCARRAAHLPRSLQRTAQRLDIVQMQPWLTWRGFW